MHGEFTSPLFTSRRRHVFAVSCKGGDSLRGMFGQRSILRILASLPSGSTVCHPFFSKKKKKKKERKTDITLSKIDDRGIRRVNIATNIWKRPRNFSRILGKLIYLEISRMSFVFVSGHHFSPKLPPRVFFTTKRRKERGNKQRFSFTFI